MKVLFIGQGTNFYKIYNIILKTLQLFYFKSTVILFEKDLSNGLLLFKANLDFNMKEINYDNLKDLLNIDNAGRLIEFRALLKKGQKGFGAYSNNKVIHRSWVILGPDIAPILHNYLRINLKIGEAFIHYCKTKRDYRGQGIYPAMLTQVLAKLKHQYSIAKAYIATEEFNVPSVKGILKAGFLKKDIRRYSHFLGIHRLTIIKDESSIGQK